MVERPLRLRVNDEKSAENGKIEEGMLLLVETCRKNILARVAQVIPYNVFYTEGDPWSEARRKNMPIPEEVARRYEICKLDLLSEIPKAEIKYPPRPGDNVIKIDPKLHEKDIFGVSRGQPKYIWYGSLTGYADSPIPLNIENIPMHMAIFGVTGSGKSFDTGALLERIVSIPVRSNTCLSYPLIIVDAHGDYADYVNHVNGGGKLGSIGWIRRYVFPEAYIRTDFRLSKLIQPIGINLDLLSQRELAEIIILFYKGTTEGAELQVDALDGLFEFMQTAKGYRSRHDLFLHNFENLKRDLNEFAEQSDLHSGTKGAVRRALDNFRTVETKYKLLSTKSDLQEAKAIEPDSIEEVKFIDKITKEGGISVFDFSADAAPGVDLKTKQFVMTYIASLLFEQFTNYKIKKQDRYLLFIIEEAQNFIPDKSYPVSSSLAHSKLSSIATQGRKFGLSLCLISQRPSFVDRIVLSMCNSFFIHRMSPEDVYFVKQVSGGLPVSLLPKLTTMNTGDLIITGQMNTVQFPLVIHVPETDRIVKPTMGKTNVCDTLAKLRNIC